MAATQEAQKLAYAKKLERAIPGIVSDQPIGHSEKAIAAINKALDYCARFEHYYRDQLWKEKQARKEALRQLYA